MNKSIAAIGLLILGGIFIYTFTQNNNDMKKNEPNERVMEEINAEEFKKKSKEDPGVVIDVRTEEEYQQGHLVRADRHYDLMNGDFEDQLDSLDKNKTYYLYCRSGNRSGKAAELMQQNGFGRVYNIGGFQDLVDSGLQEE